MSSPWWAYTKPEPEHDLVLLRPPVYNARGRNRGFETIAEAKRENKVRAGPLLKSDSKRAREFARELLEETPRDLIWSTASKLSMRQFRRVMTGLFLELLVDVKNIRMVTIILGPPFSGDWLSGDDKAPEPEEIKRVVRDAIRLHAPWIEFAMGCIEVDQDAATGLAIAHLHLIIPMKRKHRLKWLRKFFGRTAERGVHASKLIKPEDRAKTVSYQLKFTPMLKHSYMGVDRDGNPKRKTRKTRLPPPAGRRALHWLQRYSPEDFLFFYRCGLVNGRLVRTRREADGGEVGGVGL